jgi:hypothetical protein
MLVENPLYLLRSGGGYSNSIEASDVVAPVASRAKKVFIDKARKNGLHY